MSVLKDNSNILVVYPINGWGKSLTRIPKITENAVEGFYHSRASTKKHYKRSYKFLVESYIENDSVQTAFPHNSDLCFVKGKCFRSQKKNDKPHTVMTALSISTSKIIDSNCSCPVGLGGFCNHLNALLRLIVLFKEKCYDQVPDSVSCTDLPQQWNRPRCTSLTAADVMKTDWRSPKEDGQTAPLACKIFDVRKKRRTEAQVFDATEKLKTALTSEGSCTFSALLNSQQALSSV